jgi:5-methyltetrahydropteroyltriglutamate--homocysteine methyltransferase
VIGSMPRPPFVRDLLAARPRDGEPDAEWRRRMDAAVAYVIALQEQAGIDIVSDGEWRRASYVDVVAEVMDGFEYVERDFFKYHQCVVRRMEPRRPGLVAEEARFLKAHTTRAAKVCLPSPYLLGQRMWEPERSRGAYATREEFEQALVPVLRGELQALRDVGVDVVQIDEPHLCILVDPAVRAQFADPDAEAARAVDLINQVVNGIEGVHVAVHLCRRNWGRLGWGAAGGYDPIMPYLKRLNVHQLMMEFSIPVAGDFDILRELPASFQVGIGCVDVRFEEVEPPEVIADRVERALEHIAPERVHLNPDCGFAPVAESEIPLDEAYAKLKNEAAAAAILRGKRAGVAIPGPTEQPRRRLRVPD